MLQLLMRNEPLPRKPSTKLLQAMENRDANVVSNDTVLLIQPSNILPPSFPMYTAPVIIQRSTQRVPPSYTLPHPTFTTPTYLPQLVSQHPGSSLRVHVAHIYLSSFDSFFFVTRYTHEAHSRTRSLARSRFLFDVSAHSRTAKAMCSGTIRYHRMMLASSCLTSICR
jgi:hypothetical protein